MGGMVNVEGKMKQGFNDGLWVTIFVIGGIISGFIFLYGLFSLVSDLKKALL